jgi:23S rRNA-/tRNA-specific pseudouridylate synthase
MPRGGEQPDQYHHPKYHHPSYTAMELLELGAIWVNHNNNNITTVDPRRHNRRRRRRRRGQNPWKRLDKHQSSDYDFFTRSITFLDKEEIETTTLRIHAQPARFPLSEWKLLSSCNNDADNQDPWSFIRNAVVHQDLEHGYVVIDKPGGIPPHASVDNAKENILAVVKDYYDMTTRKNVVTPSTLPRTDSSNDQTHLHLPLSTVPHRLDTDTQGLQILSSQAFASYMGKLLEQKTFQHVMQSTNSTTVSPPPQAPSPSPVPSMAVQKRYRCLVCIPNRMVQYKRLQDFQFQQTIITHYVDKQSKTLPKVFVEKLPSTADGSVDKSETKAAAASLTTGYRKT